MCLYPQLLKNPKYKPNLKNGGNVPHAPDQRVLKVPVGCGNCEECRRMKKREWTVRLQEEIKYDKGQFITLTFSNEELHKLETELGTNKANTIAKTAVRRFLERWRKKYKKSVKHWLITELGHSETKKIGIIQKGSERIHLHGILFTNETNETINKLWKYGFTYTGKFCNNQTINYIVKYIIKADQEHKGYKPLILTSSGIGKQYIKTYNATQNIFKHTDTNETYKLNNGNKTSLPIYYRNKLYTDIQREQLWINKLNKMERYINGIKYNVRTEEEYEIFLKDLLFYQKENKRKGYGDNTKEWSKKDYLTQLNKLITNNN